MTGLYAWFGLLAGVVLLFANGSFVTMEYALTRLRQFPDSDFESGPLRRAWEMTERLEIYLSASKLGIAITSVGLGVVAEPALAAVLDPLFVAAGLVEATGHAGHTAVASTVAFATITLLHVTVGEQAPTYLGVERPKPVARYGAAGLRLWTRTMNPVIQFGDYLAKGALALAGVEVTRSWADAEAEEGDTRADLRQEIGELLEASDLTDERRREILRAFAIDELTVEEVMVPVEEFVALYDDESAADALQRVRESPHTRYPLLAASVRGDDDEKATDAEASDDSDGEPQVDLGGEGRVELDDVVGTVYTSGLFRDVDELLDGDLELEAVAVDPMTVPAGMAVSDLIDRLQDAEQELALVVEDRAVVGLVTVTDAFEVITGELEDPIDVEAAAAAGLPASGGGSE